MLLETLCAEFRKARSVNQTSNGYVSKIPTHTEPPADSADATGANTTGLGYPVGVKSQNSAIIVPYATGINNNTFSMRAIGWRFVGPPATRLWIPVVLGEWLCTISSSCPGVAGMVVSDTEFFADIITIVGTTGGDNALGISSPAADVIAYITLDLRGFQKFELSFSTGGSVTDCNALVGFI